MFRKLLLIFFIPVLGGCSANFHSIFRTSDADRSHIAFTDAKQSATIVNVDKDGVFRACSARSPDVFSSLATSASGSADFTKAAQSIGLAGAGSSAESTASFGLRTQLTQSQIELLHQLCIEALNGKISNDQLATELHRYQNTMVTMLAIEQLTGYAKPTVVALGGTSSTGAAKELLALQGQVSAARKKEAEAATKVETETKNVQNKQTAYDKDNKAYEDEKKRDPNSTKLKGLRDAADAKKVELDAANVGLQSAQAGLKEAQQSRSIVEKTLKSAQDNLETAASSGASQIASPSNAYLAGADAEAAKAIAAEVRNMQQTHLWQSFATDDCLRFLVQDVDREMKKWTDETQRQGIYDLCIDQIKRATAWRFENLYLSRGCDKDGKNCVKCNENCALPSGIPLPPAGPAITNPTNPILGRTGQSGGSVVNAPITVGQTTGNAGPASVTPVPAFQNPGNVGPALVAPVTE